MQFCSQSVVKPLSSSRLGQDFFSLAVELMTYVTVFPALRGTEHSFDPFCFCYHRLALHS